MRARSSPFNPHFDAEWRRRQVVDAQVLPLTCRPATHREVVPSLGNAKQRVGYRTARRARQGRSMRTRQADRPQSSRSGGARDRRSARVCPRIHTAALSRSDPSTVAVHLNRALAARRAGCNPSTTSAISAEGDNPVTDATLGDRLLGCHEFLRPFAAGSGGTRRSPKRGAGTCLTA